MRALSREEQALFDEMKERCLAKGQYKDEKAKDKFKMLCHLEDFMIQYWELLKENKELKHHLKVSKTCSLKTLEDYKSYYEDTTREQILEDTYIEYCAYVNLAHRYSELKKQLEEWKQHLKCAKEMLDMQGQKGNYDYDEYMLGLYNGMEYIISLFETREPNYISGKDIKFINNKTQQKEFIKYMNKTIEELECDDVDDEEMKGYLIQRIDTFKEILAKYIEINNRSIR